MSEAALDVSNESNDKRPKAPTFFIAVCPDGTFLESLTKKDLLKAVSDGGHENPVIIKGRRLPVTRVTKLVF
jgi:hypothetical protein